MHGVQEERGELLTAQQVQGILGVDRSTVYRMAAHGTLPGVKIGRQWRFPAAPIVGLTREMHGADRATVARFDRAAGGAVPTAVADAVVAVSAPLLGVTMVVTDMQGRPITGVANACARLVGGGPDSAVVADCLSEWRQLADEVDFEPRFRLGPMGFECARAFVRAGTELVAMVVAGGVAPEGVTTSGLHRLDEPRKQAVLAALPRIAATLSRAAAGRPSAEFTIDLEHALLHHPATNARIEARQTEEVTR